MLEADPDVREALVEQPLFFRKAITLTAKVDFDLGLWEGRGSADRDLESAEALVTAPIFDFAFFSLVVV